MKIGFPTLRRDEAPKIFLRRLKRSIVKQKLAETSNFLWPFHDVSLFSSVARPLYGKPYVLRVDGIYFDEKETVGSNTHLNRPIFNSINRAKGIVFQSEFTRQLVSRFRGKVSVPNRIIPNGVDLNEFSPNGADKRNQLGVSAGGLVMMTSATWRAHKRLSNVIDVFLALATSNENLYLVVMGGRGPEDVLVDHPRIRYTGYIDPPNLPSWYRTADVFVFLSWLDNCPNSVIEALASGVPVVCTNQGGTKEIIERTRGGIVAEADQEYGFEMVDLYSPPRPNIGAIKDSVTKILNNSAEYRARINFDAVDIDHVARQYVQFIKHCTGRQGISVE